MRIITKSLTVLLGLSAFGVTSYMLYLLFKKESEEEVYDGYVTSKHKILEVRVPKDIVRSLIGRNGSNIKRLQEESNTRINFKDKEGTTEKICVIRGSADSCNVAYGLIQDFIDNQPILDSDDFWVPVGCVRHIIGRKGEKINEIQTLSGAKMTIVEEEQPMPVKRITIKGTKEQINVARSLIEDLVLQSQHHEQTINESLAKREPRLPSKSPEVVKKIEKPKCETISPVPGQPENLFEVYVSAMESPSRFWLQIVGTKAAELDCLVEQMTEYYNNPENLHQHVLEDVNEGDVVAAVFQYDNKWYRAEVIEVTTNSDEERLVTLYFLDYGDTDVIPLKEIYELRTDFLRLHFQAIECFLARVEPVRGDFWSEAAIDRFEELCHVAQWKKLAARISGYAVKEPARGSKESSQVPGIDLYDVSKERDVNIAHELVQRGLAVFKRHFDMRSNSRTTSTSNISLASNF